MFNKQSNTLNKMTKISKHSGIYTLESRQVLNATMETAWDLLSNPVNLQKITPAKMGFQITSGKPEKMYRGQIISYKVAPFAGIKTNWVTEITHVKERSYFIDEQRFGPYKMWHHEHRISPHSEGVLMYDRVSYKIPFGFLGHIAHALFIKKQLLKIFTYREKTLDKFFNNADKQQANNANFASG